MCPFQEAVVWLSSRLPPPSLHQEETLSWSSKYMYMHMCIHVCVYTSTISWLHTSVHVQLLSIAFSQWPNIDVQSHACRSNIITYQHCAFQCLRSALLCLTNCSYHTDNTTSESLSGISQYMFFLALCSYTLCVVQCMCTVCSRCLCVHVSL